MVTICKYCEYRERLSVGVDESGPYYDDFCTKAPLEKIKQDKVTGTIYQKYHYCRNINDGNCKMFKKKPPNFLNKIVNILTGKQR